MAFEIKMIQNPKFVILDRDGVINYDSDSYIKSVDEWKALPGSIEAISKLYKAGIKVCIATNQSGIARGFYDLTVLSLMHNKMLNAITNLGGTITQIEFCTHLPDDHCDCRKPKPGMIHKILQENKWKAHEGIFVGDSITDKRAATLAGMPFFLVKTGKGEKTLNNFSQEFVQDNVFNDLAEFVEYLLHG